MYYVIPLSLLSENLTLLLNVFFMLLIMIILGLVLLSLNLQYLIEKGLGTRYRAACTLSPFAMLILDSLRLAVVG